MSNYFSHLLLIPIKLHFIKIGQVVFENIRLKSKQIAKKQFVVVRTFIISYCISVICILFSFFPQALSVLYYTFFHVTKFHVARCGAVINLLTNQYCYRRERSGGGRSMRLPIIYRYYVGICCNKCMLCVNVLNIFFNNGNFNVRENEN